MERENRQARADHFGIYASARDQICQRANRRGTSLNFTLDRRADSRAIVRFPQRLHDTRFRLSFQRTGGEVETKARLFRGIRVWYPDLDHRLPQPGLNWGRQYVARCIDIGRCPIPSSSRDLAKE